MYEQLSIFDLMQPVSDVPVVNSEGCIPAELLKPTKWEAWKYSRVDCKLNGGPYVINAMLAILPGNRLYAKEWMLYPFMHELKSSLEVEKMYQKIRKKIVERIEWNNDKQKTWQIDELPDLEDMYLYKDDEYSCKEYARKMIYGYSPQKEG